MERQFTTFYVGENLLGIDVLLVREINRTIDLTPVERAPSFIAGLLNLRGQIVTAVDMANRLNSRTLQVVPETRCIILKTNKELEQRHHGTRKLTSNDLVGLLVDRIGDMVTIVDGQLEQPPSNVNGVQSEFIEGIVRLQEQLLVVLDINEILKTEKTERTAV
jgi:purine-binding chemotaxis protein CheW